jgi:ribulose-5-phosphate 4-epimerase/fuculose-1-phosphate aldolase
MPEVQSRRDLCCRSLCFAAVVTLALLSALSTSAQSQAASVTPVAPATRQSADTDESRIADLVVANHILFYQGVLDGWGHASVRSVKNPTHYYMARSLAPALVTKDDILEFDQDSKPVDQRGREMYGERFIHGEIYRARPDVQSVVHSHSPAVIPFGISGIPLRPVMHMAGFLPQQIPVFEIRDVEGQNNSILVRNITTGAALAKVLGNNPIVLMRGHGMAIAAPSIRHAVFRAIYTQLDAAIEWQALAHGDPIYLNATEAANVDNINESSMRAWDFWAAQAEVSSAPLREQFRQANGR